MVDRSFRALALLPLLLAASGEPLPARGAGVPEAGPLRRVDRGDGRADERNRRRLPNALQNMCGSDYGGAARCGTACPGGTDGECRTGEKCFALVDCPLLASAASPGRAQAGGYSAGASGKQIIGYYASWQWYDRKKLTKPVNMDFSKVTRVNFAFFQLDEDGNVWGTDEWADPRLLFGDVKAGGECNAGLPSCRCSWVGPNQKSCSYHEDSTGLVSLVHAAQADIYPSLGGWTLSDAFPAMSADPTSRGIFARNLRDLILEYDFDGIDLDWEYPGYAAHSGTPADTANFNLLLRDVRQELDRLGAKTGRFYGLTAALPCGPANVKNIDISAVSQYLTEFNLMTYDFHGAWDEYTGVNSPLYDQSRDIEAGWSVDGCVENWVSRGAPKEKLNIGLGFYGRSFLGATEMASLHGGTDETNWKIDVGTPQYFNIMDQIDDMVVEWDEETQTPYAHFNDIKGGLVSYDDVESICLKTEYAIREDLHGFIIWELSGDVMEDFSTPLLDIVNMKLSETDVNCADPFGPRLPSPVTAATVSTPLPPRTTTTTDATTTTTTTKLPDTTTETTTTTTTTKLPDTTTETTTTTTTDLPDTITDATTTTTTTTLPNTITDATTTTTTTTLPNTTTKLPSALEDSLAQFINDGRKHVKRENRKPEHPYRPAKELGSEL